MAIFNSFLYVHQRVPRNHKSFQDPPSPAMLLSTKDLMAFIRTTDCVSDVVIVLANPTEKAVKDGAQRRFPRCLGRGPVVNGPILRRGSQSIPKLQFHIASGYDVHSSPWYRWPIEIDGLPWFTELKNGWIFHGELLVSHNQMVIHRRW